MKQLLILITLSIQTACPLQPQTQEIQKETQSTAKKIAQRLPTQRTTFTLESPTIYEKRVLRYDPETGEETYYDHKPQVVLLNAKTGEYAFKWIGYDGKEKVIIFQRHDAIDAVISATVSKTDSGQYLYTYKVENLPSSGTYLSSFALQTFTSEVKTMPIQDGHVGQMSNNKVMKDGNWIDFGLYNYNLSVVPGKSIEFKLIASAPPGLVECHIAGGKFGMKGVGEDMPQELGNLLPSYEDWPKGYTIGPIDNLKNLSSSEYAQYILKLLPQFQKLGWMNADTLQRYTQHLQQNDLNEVYKQAEQDFKNGYITTEVYNLLQELKH